MLSYLSAAFLCLYHFLFTCLPVFVYMSVFHNCNVLVIYWYHQLKAISLHSTVLERTFLLTFIGFIFKPKGAVIVSKFS